MALQSINPSTKKLIRSYTATPQADIERVLDAAVTAQRQWGETPMAERAAALRRIGEALIAGKEDYARLMALEMGKPLPQGRAEIDKCAAACEYFAVHGPAALADETAATEASRSYVAFRPLGVILAVMPWNYPFWQVVRFAAPALLAGNAIVLKHASNVCGCALEIDKVMRSVLPAGLFATVLTAAEQAGKLIDDRRIAAVTLTGSTPAGRAVAARAGAALKKCVLELGGSDPYVVLADADLEHAAETCVNARLVNTGQSCIAAKRFVVVQPVVKRFTDLCETKMRTKTYGDPLEGDFDLGPMARHDLRDELADQVNETLGNGVELMCGGFVPDMHGAFYPATLMIDVLPRHRAYHEEVFGPVASIITARDEEDAVRIANDTNFGLGAAVFSADAVRAERIARERIAAGSVFVNAQVHSDPRMPFGGIGESGFGRELGAFGLREFVNVKSIVVR